MQLPYFVEEKDKLALGFTIDLRGDWSLHAKAVAKEAQKRLCAIRRIAPTCWMAIPR